MNLFASDTIDNAGKRSSDRASKWIIKSKLKNILDNEEKLSNSMSNSFI
jgi:hypothetical protein